MAIPFDPASIDRIVVQAHDYFSQHVISWAMAAQIVVIGCAIPEAMLRTGPKEG